ncbi:hypothetical protein CPC08DRAFT_708943 [Agrocybe pediades]|nr:hypothetical protein CPC08DRAFT_708943 [Agrocybe pediades]
MTALYALTIINVALDWRSTNERFCTDGGSREEIFHDPVTSFWMDVFSSIVGGGVTFVIADGVLVWRCFHASGRSFLSTALPIGLLILETVLVIGNIVFPLVVTSVPQFLLSLELSKLSTLDSIIGLLSGAMLASVAATSLATTFIICRQIYKHTKHRSRSRRRYRKIIDALIQSSALYSIGVVIMAVMSIVGGIPSSSFKPATPQNIKRTIDPIMLSRFLGSVVVLATGIAPTLMVVRLFVSSYNEDTEVSSFSFPKDLITHPASHSNETRANNDDLEDVGAQTNQSLRIGEADGDSLISLISRHA